MPLGGCEVCSKGTEGHLQQELSCSEQMAREHFLGARRSPAGLSVTILLLWLFQPLTRASPGPAAHGAINKQ